MGSEGEEREIGCIVGIRSDAFKDGIWLRRPSSLGPDARSSSIVSGVCGGILRLSRFLLLFDTVSVTLYNSGKLASFFEDGGRSCCCSHFVFWCDSGASCYCRHQ